MHFSSRNVDSYALRELTLAQWVEHQNIDSSISLNLNIGGKKAASSLGKGVRCC